MLGCGSDSASDTTADTGSAVSVDATDSSEVAATVMSSAASVGESSRYPDVIDATATSAGDGWTFSATISSPYDSPERYADAWRVVAPDGSVLGVRELTHDHAAEQPFTRSLPDVVVPASIEVVTIEARDSEYGWGGATVDVELTDP